MNTPVKFFSRKNFGLLIVGLCFAGGMAVDANAQGRDPFAKPVVRSSASRKSSGTSTTKTTKSPDAIAVPSIQQRIDSYKAIRMVCAERGVACPKPTSVLTVDEMQVTGIFRTPRGYAAMVEATPIKLSYTIYPGEKFYDGQLVAIEETKLIFRRIKRLSDGKEAVGVDTKVLRQAAISDMSASRSEQASPTVAVAAPTQGISAEAVPMTENKSDKPAAVDTSGLQSTKPESAKDAAASSAATETADSAKAEPAKKAKGKSKSKKQ